MNRQIKIGCSYFILLLCLGVLTCSAALGADEQTLESRLNFSLPVPGSPEHQSYLGVSEDRFSLGQVDADILIIEIFSMYCPFCQKEAVNVNRLYNLIQNPPKLNQKIKLIGIGAGNSEFEVNFFKKKYDIPFPLFSDTKFTLHKQIGQVRTPHFFGLKIDRNNNFKVFYSKPGNISDPELFLKSLLDHADREN